MAPAVLSRAATRLTRITTNAHASACRRPHTAHALPSDDAAPSARPPPAAPAPAPVPTTTPRVGFLGVGNMGEAMLRGFLAAGAVSADAVSASVRSDARRAALAALGVASVHGDAVSAGGAAAVAAAADVVFVAVKPAACGDVLAALAPHVDVGRHVVVSVAAGVSTAALEAALPPGARVVRAMPNTPCLVGAGATVYAAGAAATPADGAVVARLLEAVGIAVPLPEHLIDAATGVSGCGPAYVLLAIEALADGGVREGLPRDVAIALAAHTVAGAAKLVTDGGGSGGGVGVPAHPALLREAVCSPGGATIAGLGVLEDAAVRGALANAVRAAAARARELGR